MSIVAMKNKSVIKHGSKRSGVPPGGYWLPRGPFGVEQKNNGLKPAQLDLSINNFGPVGFSLSGTHRNIGGVGRTMHMSKSGTPFRGQDPVGNGGCCNTYATPLPTYNVNQVITQGDQYLYVKPSVLSERGMLRTKYRFLYNGQFPNYFSKEVYTGNKTDNASQGVYLSNLSAANDSVLDINEGEKYKDYTVRCGATDCRTSTALFKYNTMAANAPYTKHTKNPIDSSSYTLRLRRGCATSNCDPKKRPQPKPDNGLGIPCAMSIPNTLTAN
jgi:hypothetical protein|tara:strand:+ start:12068 stop:12883 length:816 start_codon:yes stop_codon:yes gene_type:complete